MSNQSIESFCKLIDVELESNSLISQSDRILNFAKTFDNNKHILDIKTEISKNRNFSKIRNKIWQGVNCEIVVICWNTGMVSPIHDHPENGCLLVPITGNLYEDVWRYNKNKELINVSNNILKKNSISFLQGRNGLHSIMNKTNEPVISFHVYSPINYVPKTISK